VRIVAAFVLLVLASIIPLLVAGPALAADLCQAVAASGSARYLLEEKSGGIVEMAKPAPFPADVKAFVVKSDETFQDQDFEIFALGSGGAGLAVHYKGTLAEQYVFAFDRVGGKLVAVNVPNLNPQAKDYREAKIATIGGTPALFSNDAEGAEIVTRIVPWAGHQWGAVCDLATAKK
jgi:hypothetical protein